MSLAEAIKLLDGTVVDEMDPDEIGRALYNMVVGEENVPFDTIPKDEQDYWLGNGRGAMNVFEDVLQILSDKHDYEHAVLVLSKCDEFGDKWR